MDAKDIRNLSEAYISVYQPQEINEEAEIASEYFYEMGLNEHGIDILIEELGVEEFATWVDEIIEECTLDEERAAKKRTGGKSYEQIKAEIDAREAAKTKARKPAVTAAKAKQPETKATPTQTKQGIGARIGSALQYAGQRAKQDTALLGKSIQTARDVATRRGAEAKAVYDALRERGKKAEQSPQATRARRQATVATGRAMQAAGRTAIKAAGAAGAAAGAGVKAKREGKTGAQIAGRAAGTFVRKMTKEEYDFILDHLLDEGYASDMNSAEVIMVNMSEEWVSEILDESRGGEASPGAPKSFHKLSRGKKAQKGIKTSYDNQGNMIRKYATMQLQKRKEAPYNEEVELSNYDYHQLLKFLYFEGFGNSYEEVENLLEEITDEEFDEIIEAFFGEAKSDAGLSTAQKRQIRTARSGLTGPHADYERRGAHRDRDERNKDLADLRKGKKKDSSHFSYLP